MPDEMPEIELDCGAEGMSIATLLTRAELVTSTSEAMRMVQQGAVRIDGERVTDKKLEIAAHSTHIFQVGKRRFARVTLG